MWIPELGVGRWALGAAAAICVGIAKTGLPGFGTVAVPLMVLAVGDARQSAGWLLPLLCVADVFAVVLYRRHAYARRLLRLFPWVLGGMAVGAAALGAPERVLRPLVGGIVLAMVGLRAWRLRRGAGQTPLADPAAGPPAESWRHTGVYGSVAGFATTIANAAGPVMSLYFLSQRLPKDEFVGTGAWFFLFVNLCKIPIYTGHGFIGARSLAFDLALLPALVAGAVGGRVLLGRLGQVTFERLVLALTLVATALLFIPK